MQRSKLDRDSISNIRALCPRYTTNSIHKTTGEVTIEIKRDSLDQKKSLLSLLNNNSDGFVFQERSLYGPYILISSDIKKFRNIVDHLYQNNLMDNSGRSNIEAKIRIIEENIAFNNQIGDEISEAQKDTIKFLCEDSIDSFIDILKTERDAEIVINHLNTYPFDVDNFKEWLLSEGKFDAQNDEKQLKEAIDNYHYLGKIYKGCLELEDTFLKQGKNIPSLAIQQKIIKDLFNSKVIEIMMSKFIPKLSSDNWKRFKPKGIYTVDIDHLITYEDSSHPTRVTPKQKGIKLVARYYEKKYQANITFPTGENFHFKDIKRYIDEAKKKYGDNDIRVAFYFGSADKHATPVVYIRENGQEGIFYADSLGATPAGSLLSSGMNVYAIEDPRQKDPFSCYTDALVFACDITAKDPLTNEYYIPELLSFLKAHSVKTKCGYYKTKIPDQLLKTSQSSRFTMYHHDKPTGELIHKGKTLEEFRDDYTEEVHLDEEFRDDYTDEVHLDGTGKKRISTYLIKKGVKYADLIEIQFYVEQMQKICGPMLNDDIIFEFIRKAKVELKKQGPAAIDRIGLFEFATKFATEYISKIQIKILIEELNNHIVKKHQNGSERFFNKSDEIEKCAVQKLINSLNQNQTNFTSKEISALLDRNSGPGKIIAQFEKVNPAILPKPILDAYKKQRQENNQALGLHTSRRMGI